MSEVITHTPGTTCWVELGTTDPAAARSFYQALFGWTPVEVPMPDGNPYTLFQHGAQSAGGVYKLPAEMQAGVPPHWMLYTVVENVDAAADTAVMRGGAVVAPAMDVPNAGRMAMMQDPEGASFAIMHPAKGAPGLGAKDEPGGLCWTELSSRDPEAAASFYGALFGWDARPQETPGGPYTMFSSDGTDVGGMVTMNGEWGEMPAAWMPYFGVADLDDALRTVAEHGGKAVTDPIEAKGVGRFAVVQDPQGAHCSVIQLDAFG